MTLFTLAHVHSCTTVSCISGTSAMLLSRSLLICQSSIHMSAYLVDASTTAKGTVSSCQHVQHPLGTQSAPPQKSRQTRLLAATGSTTASSGMLLIPAPPKPSGTGWTDSSECMLCNIALFTCRSNIKHTMLRQTTDTTQDMLNQAAQCPTPQFFGNTCVADMVRHLTHRRCQQAHTFGRRQLCQASDAQLSLYCGCSQQSPSSPQTLSSN